MSKTVRVAGVQAAPVFLDADATVAKAVSLIEEAASNGAELVAFAESWLPGYPSWIFGAAGWEDAGAKAVYRRFRENAIAVPSAATDTLCRAARANGVVVVMGMTERDTDTVGGSLYNSLLYISAEGTILGVHRKLMPTHAERIVWGQGDGSGLLVVETGAGRVGGLICWEHWMPLSRFAMHAEREEIHVAAWPEVGDPEMHRFASRHYAFEGRCFSICVMGASMTAGALPGGLRAAAGDGRGRRLHRGRVGLGAARDDDLRPRRHRRRRRARRRGDDRLRRLRPRPHRGGAAVARRRGPLQPPRHLRPPRRRLVPRARHLEALARAGVAGRARRPPLAPDRARH